MRRAPRLGCAPEPRGAPTYSDVPGTGATRGIAVRSQSPGVPTWMPAAWCGWDRRWASSASRHHSYATHPEFDDVDVLTPEVGSAGDADVYVMRLDGSHMRNVTTSFAWENSRDWGPRGR
jgi:hypothetical protein